MECCGKIICNGCEYANMKREEEMRVKHTCPFCREAVPETDEDIEKYRMKRIEANDPVAMFQEGGEQYYNKGNFSVAFEFYKKAAELGDASAHYQLSLLYLKGHGVEKDKGKEIYHAEEAAIGGHPAARHNLGNEEWRNDNFERAVKHHIIAAALGEELSIKVLIGAFKRGFVQKEDLAATLRAHQAAVDATKSPQRKAGDEYKRYNPYL